LQGFTICKTAYWQVNKGSNRIQGAGPLISGQTSPMQFTRNQKEYIPVLEKVNTATFLIYPAIYLSEKFLDCFQQLA
jgi:hypothetical protein